MPRKAPHRKRVKHFHQPGDFHELTFSCYHRLPLLTNDLWRRWLAESIDAASIAHEFHLNAFVFMPEHVHLPIWPTRSDMSADEISTFLAAVKRPVSRRVKAALSESDAGKSAERFLKRLTTGDRPGSSVFRFWQEGPGYDRNLENEKSVTACIEYLHSNPVGRRLVKSASDWKWSSARWYASDCQKVDPDLPKLHFPPRELYDPCVV